MVTLPFTDSLFIESCKPVPKSAIGGPRRSRWEDTVIRALQSIPALPPASRTANRHLCKLCRRITVSKLRFGCFHHASLECLQASAKTCALCSLLYECMEAEPDDTSQDDTWPQRLWLQGITEPRKPNLVASIHVTIGVNFGRLHLFTDKDDAMASTIVRRPIALHADNPDSFGLARSWMRECDQNHPECGHSTTSADVYPQLPSRVIDVGEDGDFKRPRVLFTKGQRGRWIALSHCWGQTPLGRFRLTSQNRDSLQQGIVPEDLPQTFRDAIHIARQLRIRYLWIDSFCILQDSHEDWERESAIMPAIYAGAYLVLAANATPTTYGGILRPRDYERTTLDLGPRGRVSFRHELAHEKPDFLAERAWCYQEEYLGHRRLTYYKGYMSFGCTRVVLSEDDYVRQLDSKYYESFKFTAAALETTRRRLPEGADLSEVRAKYNKLWLHLISEYSSRKLTVADDKLVAISGLASLMALHVQDRYLAGLWQSTLPFSLLWSRLDPAHFNKPTKYRAPSWSWASVDGRLVFTQHSFSTSCEVIEATINLQGLDPHGQVQDGSLTLRAPLKKAIVGKSFIKKVYRGSRVHIPLLDPEGNESIGDGSHCKFDVADLPEGTQIWCLEIEDNGGGSRSSSGLILVPTGGERLHEYRRVGLFSLDSYEDYTWSSTWFEGCERQVVTIL